IRPLRIHRHAFFCVKLELPFYLLSLELRLTLLHVSLQSFLGVLASKQKLLKFALDSQRFTKANFRAGDDRSLDASHGARRLVRRAELPRIRHNIVPERL